MEQWTARGRRGANDKRRISIGNKRDFNWARMLLCKQVSAAAAKAAAAARKELESSGREEHDDDEERSQFRNEKRELHEKELQIRAVRCHHQV